MGTRKASLKGARLLVCLVLASVALGSTEVIHTKTYWSPPFELGSGDVVDSFALLDFPTGHIGLRNFFAEVVDADGNSVPLYEVYLHHWVVIKLHVKKGKKQLTSSVPKVLPNLDLITGHFDMRHDRLIERMAFEAGADPLLVGTNVGEDTELHGSCMDEINTQTFGLGSETRRTNTTLPAPYAIEAGDPEKVPEGYEEAWYLNVHAIDTRGAVDATSCLECLCEAYGVTKDKQGKPFPEGYTGGYYCCYDKTHCAVKQGFEAARRKLFLRYVVTWVDWHEYLQPVRSYFFDASDTRTSLAEKPVCKIEYKVEQCSEGTPKNECIDHRHAIGALPVGGDVVYAALHQHAAGLGAVLYDEDGVVICSSEPIYGQGNEAGDEAGYVVGMTTCYPDIGNGYIETMKELHLDAYYSSEKAHTGVMSVFYLLVANPAPLIEEII